MSKKTSSPPRPPLHTSRRSDDADAFLPDPYGPHGRKPMRSGEPLAEMAGEAFVASVTMGEAVQEDVRDAVTTEELGGPFVPSPSNREFADDVDGTNPEGATVEPFPTTSQRAR